MTARRSLLRHAPYVRFIVTGVVFFVVQAVFNLWHTTNTMRAGSGQTLLWYVATYQAVLRDLQIHGVALFLVLGVSLRLLPALYGAPTLAARTARATWALLLAGVIGEVVLFLAYRFTGDHRLAAGLLVPWLLLAAGSLRIAASFARGGRFPRRTARRSSCAWPICG